MARNNNAKESLRTIKMTHSIYVIDEQGEFSCFEDDNYYKQKTMSEATGIDKVRRYGSRYQNKKNAREYKDTKTKGRCHNVSYKLSEKRFNKGGGNNGHK